MRKQYTSEEKSAWNKRYYENKRRLGWEVYSFLLPVIVGKAVRKLKCELMAEYKKSNAGEGE